MIKDHWNNKVSVAKNLSNFGLTNDPSKSILVGFSNIQPQVQEDKVQNKKVREMLLKALRFGEESKNKCLETYKINNLFIA